MATHDHEDLKGLMMKKAFGITGLKYPNAVQKVYVGTRYLYTLQKHGNDQVISRAPIEPFNAGSQDVVINHSETMALTDFGHGRT